MTDLLAEKVMLTSVPSQDNLSVIRNWQHNLVREQMGHPVVLIVTEAGGYLLPSLEDRICQIKVNGRFLPFRYVALYSVACFSILSHGHGIVSLAIHIPAC